MSSVPKEAERSNMTDAATSGSATAQKRKLCTRCSRPAKVCVCSALPSTPLAFQRCQVIVLQHPHESRRKNRSMPLVQLCVEGAMDDKDALSWGGKKKKKKKKKLSSKKRKIDDAATSTTSFTAASPQTAAADFHLRAIVHRRLGDEVDPSIMKLINDPNRDLILMFPGPDAISLEDGLAEVERRKKERTEKSAEKERNDDACNDDKIVILFLDATWRYAKEMERANSQGNWWPKNIIRVQISPKNNDCGKRTESGKEKEKVPSNEAPQESKAKEAGYKAELPVGFKPRRFNIRTPPSSQHLSTAECIAWIVSSVEDNPSIYETLMKPLDLMVEKWKSFSDDGRRSRGFTEGDGSMEDEEAEGRGDTRSKGRRKGGKRNKR